MDHDRVEATTRSQIPFWHQIWNSIGITPEVRNWKYNGSGTQDDPYIVTWIDQDPRDPMRYSALTRWSLMMLCAMCALLVAIDSSAYSGGPEEIMNEFNCSKEIFTLGISLFVLGFAVGPIL